MTLARDGWLRIGRTFLACAAGSLCAAPALAQTADIRVRLGVSADATRVVLDSPSVVSVAPAQADDGRLVFNLTGLDLARDLQGAGLGLVKDWRLENGQGGARLTLDLVGPSAVKRRFLIPPGLSATGYRYVIDLALPAVLNSDSLAVLSPPRPERTATLRRAREVVVIDAGHGGHDPGAQSADASEKDITLAAALALRDRLQRGGRYKVVMTRTSDVLVPLGERVRIARRAGADLFIALHADSAGSDAQARGASVYTLSDHGETRVNQVLDGHEWFSHAGARNDPSVNGILLDLTQRSTLNRSCQFAQLLVDRLSDKIDLLPRSHRDAGYFVLLAPDVPAVLLEMGFISNPVDEARLTDPSQRGKLMDAVASAIDAYFSDGVRVAAR